MKSLVGYTGFVGSNLYAQTQFDNVYNSENIKEAFQTSPDILVYAGVRAQKFIADKFPQEDMKHIIQAQENIERINPRKLVLISTIDVFNNPDNVNEMSPVNAEKLNAYGYNRYMLEEWVRKNFPEALIVRLPGLYGKNIKKNFIYDYINVIPSMLDKNKFNELCSINPFIEKYYKRQDNGYYKADVSDKDKDVLKDYLKKAGFTALNFTDSRSEYQFYNLARLWKDITVALDNEIRLLHPAVEPVSAGELYKYLKSEVFDNQLNSGPVRYNYKTIYSNLYGGKDGYIYDKKYVMSDIKNFIENNHN